MLATAICVPDPHPATEPNSVQRACNKLHQQAPERELRTWTTVTAGLPVPTPLQTRAAVQPHSSRPQAAFKHQHPRRHSVLKCRFADADCVVSNCSGSGARFTPAIVGGKPARRSQGLQSSWYGRTTTFRVCRTDTSRCCNRLVRVSLTKTHAHDYSYPYPDYTYRNRDSMDRCHVAAQSRSTLKATIARVLRVDRPKAVAICNNPSRMR
jgi:hypothetical protein